jgi:hypothetical protein
MAFNRSNFSAKQFQSIVDVIYGTATVDPADMAAGAESNISVTITGVALGDIVLAAPGVLITDGVVWSASVVSANTVKIVFGNLTGDHINMASSTWNFLVLRPKGDFAAL